MISTLTHWKAESNLREESKHNVSIDSMILTKMQIQHATTIGENHSCKLKSDAFHAASSLISNLPILAIHPSSRSKRD
ncbi:hypothetical protein Tco_1226011 [Tanacetum coccineum]|uniref:Uncharacterized protein n=1 Tax=Tanacetum coccineum TaxID=301880 RepID=A0ABQ5FJB0_9ASTR